ncbi:hypothetical protein N8878_02545 [Psychromonas sp.]|nr:hypothetical protein [Psychromonas sp.]
MEINSAFSSGVMGLNNASQQINKSSEAIANQPLSSESTTESSSTSEPITAEVINMKLAEIQAKASVKVITTADDMVGSLINVSV